ncbi:MAG: dihydrofolate reductase [Acholeplasmataceae bacterium]|jgi:dihydrofolate reductase|nr:dihydrofolate reductase [Acholeplasmataceae bacterium]
MISLIWAMDENWLIGKDNKLPWHYPKDLAYFKAHTKGQTVLMGEMTYLSLKDYYQKKPLPFGKIYVANLEEKTYEDAHHVKDLKQFLLETKEDVMVIGGKTIYQLSLPYAKYLYITFVLGTHPGNVYFPQFNLDQFKLINKQVEEGLIFAVYERISS